MVLILVPGFFRGLKQHESFKILLRRSKLSQRTINLRSMETGNNTNATVGIRNRFTPKKASVLLLLVIFVVVSAGCFFLFRYYTATIAEKNRIMERGKKYEDAYRASLLKNSPEALQNAFVEDLRAGINDQFTKSAADFVTHRFFDNGGNIYEVYDYVNSHPELSFLKEAEPIYPNTFRRIGERKVKTTGEDESILAYAAYVEVLRNHGYADMAALTTVANQYARIVYFRRTIAPRIADRDYAQYYTRATDTFLRKASEFADAAQADVVKVLDGDLDTQTMPARDILVGLNQYASAIRFFETLGFQYSSVKSSREVFSFSMEYSRKYVPELMHFTSLINATTLALLPSSGQQEVKEALYPILNLDTKKIKLLDTSIIHKVIDARFEPRPATVYDIRLGTYSKRNIVRISEKSPEFRGWLVSNGWKEDDFIIEEPEG